jgi:hypothetical protein
MAVRNTEYYARGEALELFLPAVRIAEQCIA